MALVVLIVVGVAGIQAQTTEFTYQGSLKDGGNAANGDYELHFGLTQYNLGGNRILGIAGSNNLFVGLNRRHGTATVGL
jgi:hypothetical protein